VEKESLPDCLEITAETEDGLIMGLSHKTKPIHGVQFHPESIATQYGLDLLSNFFTIAKL
jgi:anthranilate synthase component 2